PSSLSAFPARRSSDLPRPALLCRCAFAIRSPSAPFSLSMSITARISDERGPMRVRIVRWLSLICTAVTLGALTAHVLELPNKLRSEEHTSELQSRFDL